MLKIIFNNPGLKHITENIFCNLRHEDLEVCRNIDQYCKKVLDEPMFWLRKFIRRGLSMKNQLDWTKAIQLTKNTNLKKNVLSYLKKCSKNERVVNLPCYINEKIVKNSEKLIKKYYGKLLLDMDDGDEGIIQLLAPLLPNSNAPDKDGMNPILYAVALKNKPIVQILAPMTANPNSRGNNLRNPIAGAAMNNQTEMIQILAPLIENPNEPEIEGGLTPFHIAAAKGALEVVKLFVPLINNVNVTEDVTSWTAMHPAALNGRIEIKNFLAPLMDEFNSRDVNGNTPFDLAIKNGHHESVEFLKSYKKPSKRARLK